VMLQWKEGITKVVGRKRRIKVAKCFFS
jgi:hypothetical protein